MTTADHGVDMSAEAVAQRLEEVRALYKLTSSLGEAEVLGRVEPDAQERAACSGESLGAPVSTEDER